MNDRHNPNPWKLPGIRVVSIVHKVFVECERAYKLAISYIIYIAVLVMLVYMIVLL